MVKWVSETIGALEGAVNIGVVNTGEEAFMIDTGIDNSAINKVMKSIDFEINGAIITHHHADHMGGCNKLESLGISNLYGPQDELELFTKPYIEPFTMFGGSSPPKKLRNRHLEAKPSESILSASENPFGRHISCPGHSPGHTAYLVDDVLFSGDAAFTQETIEKYNLLFAVNPKLASESLDVLEKTKFSMMIPGHGPLAEDRNTAIDVIKATR
ncbi:MAG: MBL fold metallo-hydrolase, partial [Candidatus Kariarchaeaceae archaeon]